MIYTHRTITYICIIFSPKNTYKLINSTTYLLIKINIVSLMKILFDRPIHWHLCPTCNPNDWIAGHWLRNVRLDGQVGYIVSLHQLQQRANHYDWGTGQLVLLFCWDHNLEDEVCHNVPGSKVHNPIGGSDLKILTCFILI